MLTFLSAGVVFGLWPGVARAEDLLPAGVIPKLPKTANDPTLLNGKVYPFWGPVCQRYTYSVIYSDKDGRPPEYVKIYFNGRMIDMQKENADDNDYKRGVRYIFQNVPNKYGSNFYYFEASNGLGKSRASIIDSPDNGPVLFESDFKNNEIVLIDPVEGKELWRYQTEAEWIGAVALSNDGKYLAAQSSDHVYLFDTAKNEPLWIYNSPTGGTIGGDVKGGVAISADGSKIFAALNGKALYFNNKSEKPVWIYNLEQNGGGAYGVDISKDGSRAAAAMAGSESDDNSNVLILFDSEGKKLWQYHSPGNWHEVSFSENGLYLAGATGCPDRRGYIFSIDSAEPLVKSEPLSVESPVDEARVSADGEIAAFGAESNYGAVILMSRNTKEIIWKFEIPGRKSVRALAMTPDGEFIGAGTFGGDVLIFEKNSNIPVEKIKINSAIGAFDMSDDGGVFVTGSADKKVRIFHKGENRAMAEIILQEYVGELDVSADGRFAAAGTSGAVYFFESIMDLNSARVADCAKVIEPPEENSNLFGGQNSINSPAQEDKIIKKNNLYFPIILPITLTAISTVALIAYILICRIKKINIKKWILITLISFVAIFAFATGFFGWKNKQESRQNPILIEKGIKTNEPSICGDGMCNPSGGETPDNCPKDCNPSN